jgi:hypothetical protein
VYALYERIPALCYGPISCGIHGFDESVSLPSVKRINGVPRQLDDLRGPNGRRRSLTPPNTLERWRRDRGAGGVQRV